MIEILIDHINNMYPLSPKIIKEFQSYCEIKKYKQGEFLCEMDKINDKFFFVLDGVVRTYMEVGEGKKKREINKSIAAAGHPVSSLKSIKDNEPAKIACQALTEATIVQASYDKLTLLRNKYPEFTEFMYQNTLDEYTKLEEAHINLLSKNATERYLILKENIKNIDQLIPQFQIASHLGITPIQLSRIRRNLLKS